MPKTKNHNPFRWPFTFIFSLLFALVLFSLDFSAFDFYSHLSFAKHYKNNWFSLINQKFSGGLDLGTYPPLAHQLLVLLSFLFPLEISYQILLLGFWILLSYSSTKFFVDYLGLKKGYDWLIYLFIFSSLGILKTIFVFGQLTTIIGLAFGFTSLYWFNKALKEKKLTNFLLFSFSLALMTFTHLFSVILFSLFYFILLVFEWKSILPILKLLTLSLGLTTIFISLSLFPIFEKFFTNSLIPQKEIRHFSRTPLISLFEIKRQILSSFGLPMIMLIMPLFLYLTKEKNKRKFLVLYSIAIFFFLIGLGRTTPLSKILLNLEYWVTYDRFLLVSSIILTAFFAIFLPRELIFEGLSISLLFLIIYLILNFFWLQDTHSLFWGVPINYKHTIRENVTQYVLTFLNNLTPDYRYQTFGYGRPIGQIYLYTNVPTLDTDYFTGRTIPWIRNSGFDEIDQVRDKKFLDLFFTKASNYSVRYVITCSEFYHNYLKVRGWQLINNKSFDGLKIIVWENPKPVPKIKPKIEDFTLANYLWGTIPLFTLVIYLFLLLRYKEINETLLHFRFPTRKRESS